MENAEVEIVAYTLLYVRICCAPSGFVSRSSYFLKKFYQPHRHLNFVICCISLVCVEIGQDLPQNKLKKTIGQKYHSRLLLSLMTSAEKLGCSPGDVTN